MRESIVEPREKFITLAAGLAAALIGTLIGVQLLGGAALLCALALIILGCYEFYRWSLAPVRSVLALIDGGAALLAALICLCNYFGVIFTWEAHLYTFPLWAIVSGLLKLLRVVQLYRGGEYGWGWMLLCALLSALAGVLLLILPAAGIMTMSEFSYMVIGLVLLLHGVHVVVDAFA